MVVGGFVGPGWDVSVRRRPRPPRTTTAPPGRAARLPGRGRAGPPRPGRCRRQVRRHASGLPAAQAGDLDELRTRANAGDEEAAGLLAGLLIEQGRREEGERLRRFGLNPDGSITST